MPRKNNDQRAFVDRVDAPSVESELSAVAVSSVHDVRKRWVSRFGSAPPPVRSPAILRQLFAWQLQCEVAGGMDTPTERALTNISEALNRGAAYEPGIRRELAPGVVLTREWKGFVHKVTVTSEGFQYQGKVYRSLSDIARTITGTRWSGPRFFGLEQKHKQKRTMVGETQ